MKDLIQYRLTDKPRFFLLIGDKALEIVNPDVLSDLFEDATSRWYHLRFGRKSMVHELKHNDTFSLPDGVEFEEFEKCVECEASTDEDCMNGPEECDVKNRKFIRLSKKEEKEPVKETTEEIIDLKALERKNKQYNGGQCKVNCNCIEVAEFNNGGEGVKSYACLKPSNEHAKLKSNKAIMENKTNKPYSLQDALNELSMKEANLSFERLCIKWGQGGIMGIIMQAAELYASKATEELRKENETLKDWSEKQNKFIDNLGQEIERLKESNLKQEQEINELKRYIQLTEL